MPLKPTNTTTTPTTTTPQEFTHTIAKLAVSQICQSIGFKGSTTKALNTLTTITTKYMQSLATSAASYAASANRTGTNLIDLTHALEDHCAIQGFKGLSTLGCGSSSKEGRESSVVLSEVTEFVRVKDEVPFVKAVPKMGLAQNSVFEGREEGGGGGMRGRHVPEWLPRFPEFDESRNAVDGGGGCVEFGEDKCDGKLVAIRKQQQIPGESMLLPKERERVVFRIEVGKKSKRRMMFCGDVNSVGIIKRRR